MTAVVRTTAVVIAAASMLAISSLYVLADEASSSAPVNQWWKTCGSAKSCVVGFHTGAPGDLNSVEIDIGKSSGGPLAVVHLSLDAELPFGATWQIDKQKPIIVPFMACNDGTCRSQVVINDDYLGKLRHGSVLHISYKEMGEKPTSVDFSLKGFGPVYDGK